MIRQAYSKGACPHCQSSVAGTAARAFTWRCERSECAITEAFGQLPERLGGLEIQIPGEDSQRF